jgi:hypothetical protein
MLFMLELTLVVRYFQHSARRTLHKICIGAIFAADLCCTVTICTETYVVVLVTPCQPSSHYHAFNLRNIALIIFSTYATAVIAQLFLCVMYFTL